MIDNSAQKQFRITCVVCGEGAYEPLFQPSRSPGPVVKCKNCGFVFVNPIETTRALIEEGAVLGGRPAHLLQSSNLADIKGSWEERIIDAHLRELPAKELNAQEALGHIESITNQRGRLLDFGCFCGLFLNEASIRGWDCYGIEPLVGPAIYARGRFDLPVVTDTLRDDTYPADFFDVVTSFQVFEHLVYPDREIEKIRNILKPGGFLMVEVPNIDTITVKTLGSRHRHFVKDHVSFFSGETLEVLLNRLGFEVRKQFYPTRTMSLQHLFWWMNKESGLSGRFLSERLPRSLLMRSLRFSLGDIVTVIAQKV